MTITSEGVMRRFLEDIEPRPWTGRTFRVHQAKYRAERPSSRNYTGRYHRGADHYPIGPNWSAHYSSLESATPGFELLRHTTASALNQRINTVLSEINVSLSLVLDLSDPAVIGFSIADLTGPEYTHTHTVAWEALQIGWEGLLVPSAALEKAVNLVWLPDNQQAGSYLEEVSRRAVYLYP